MKVASLGKNIYIYGKMVHHAYNSFGKYDYLYSINNKHLISKFIRPFKRIKFLKNFGFFKINANSIDLKKSVHYQLLLGTKDFVMHNLTLNMKKEPSWVYMVKKNKIENKILVIRTNIYNKATYSIVPYSPMYSFSNTVKIKLARIISLFQKKLLKKNVNLYFEKFASKADESGIRVFEKVMELKPTTSRNYFILDRTAKEYHKLKKVHRRNIIERFSFKHYLYIFLSDYFIGSDLSNHVINDRIYINSLMKKIREVPLIFLQHGIMFAKPVENPMGKIFYKEHTPYNIYKNIVSSKLEAKEFYKMGYSDSDLIYSGLSTFDYAKLDKSSNKIVFMPTYRFWEEGMILGKNIKQTTYYKSILKVIKSFELAGLKDRLRVVAHNKFAEYIYESLPEYRDLLLKSPSDALKIGRIFISDYSSAIYDAIFRGAYPIFYWEEKKLLIEKYKAVPPVNEENAPGPIAYSTNELIALVLKAIEMDYTLETIYQQKYKQINEFNDCRNTERIINYLLKEKIL